jgi:hypothetical protein
MTSLLPRSLWSEGNAEALKAENRPTSCHYRYQVVLQLINHNQNTLAWFI